MNHLNILSSVATATAMAALLSPHVFAQGASLANTTEPYTATSPANCCIYKPPAMPGQNINGMKVYLWSGLKTHGDGQHDYPQLLADFSKLLTTHGAVVEGGFHPPSADELSRADVVIVYKGDAGFMSKEQHAALTAYVRRGGGLVQFHDSLCGPDTADAASFARVVVDAIAAAGLRERVTVQSFDWRTLIEVKRLAPGIATVCLTIESSGMDTVRRTAEGFPVFTPGLAGLVLGEFRRLAGEPAAEEAPVLTERETEVLRLVAKGLTARQIGERLVVSHRTVESHVQNTLRKLQLHNRVQLVRYAIERGLTDADG